jgi:aminopeptidase YwaD
MSTAHTHSGSMNQSSWRKIFSVIVLASIAFLLTWAAVHLIATNRSRALPDITADRLAAHLKYLSSDELVGRLAGTPGAEKAAEYIAREFKSYGLRAEGERGGYLQSFTFVSGVRLGNANRAEVFYDKSLGRTASQEAFYGDRQLRLGTEFMPAAFSQNGTFRGSVSFVGYGISAPELDYDDYQGLEVKEKFVFVLRHGPEGDDIHSKFGKYHALRHKALNAREKGARGIVYIDDGADFSKSTLSRLRYDNSFADSGIAAFAISRPLAREIFLAAGVDLEALQKQIESNKKAHSAAVPSLQIEFQCDLAKETQSTANVLGYLEGSDAALKQELIVVGAHYDHLGMGENGSLAFQPGREIHNGADDNASGTAGVLELARVSSLHAGALKRSLLFIAFSAEEEGLLGSRYYVNHPAFPLEKTVAMINMDMIGRMRDKRLIIGGAGTSPVWRDLLARLNRGCGFELKFQDDGYGPSDHSSFYGKDIAVLFFFTGVHSDYHRPTDDYEKLDTSSEEKLLKFVYRVTAEVDTFDTRPLFTKAKEAPRPEGGSEFRVYLGTIPDYGEEVNGVKLSGVREGSPAARAGLKGGDIIVECAGKEIKNIYDYTYVLQEHKAGEVVDIVVLRNLERISLKATLESRP